MRARVFGTTGIRAALAMTFLAGCHPSENGVQTNRDGSKPDFVGVQKDYWCAVAPDRIRVTSELTLRKRPAKAVVMSIRSPCARAQLETVAVAGHTLDFRKTARGTYDVNLPSDKQVGRERRILFKWLLPLRELKYESGLFWTRPRALIPVVSYELRAGVEPQSGFEVFGETAENRPVVYSWNFGEPMGEFGGECALPIRPRR